MKTLVAGSILLIAVIVGVVFFWPTSRSGAQPIRYGQDVCDSCRMHISRPGFAGELRDDRGTLKKYDDIGCLVRAMRGTHREIPELWVEDHAGGGLIALLGATLVRGEAIDTPMGSRIVAFADESAARAFARDRGGQIIALESLLAEAERPTQSAPTETVAARDGGA